MKFIKIVIILFISSLAFNNIIEKEERAKEINEEIIETFENFFRKNNIVFINEIDRMISDYQEKTNSKNYKEVEEMISTLSALKRDVEVFYQQKEKKEEEKIVTRDGLVPDPLIFPETIVIAAIIIYFDYIDCPLAAELIAHASVNSIEDSIYYPVNGYILAESTTIQNLACDIGRVTEGYEFDGSGEDDMAQELFYSIKCCEYEKKYYDSDSVTFHLRDRYDFPLQSNIFDSLFNFATGTMYYYQEAGFLTPFITDISVVVDGYVPFDFSISGNNATIDYIPSYVTNLTIPSEVLNINSYVDINCSDDANIISIDDSAAYNCTGLLSVSIPSSVTYVGDDAFKGCTSLTSVSLPNSVTYLGESTFEGCSSLTSVSLSSSLNDIEDYTFKNCSSLSSISFPNNISTIGDYAFMGCTSLEEVDIPSSVVCIGGFAFSGCTYLEDVSINKETIPLTSLGASAFYSCSSSLAIEVPHNRIADYINSSGWSYYQSIIEPDDSFYSYDIYNNANTTIPGYLFSGCNVLYELDIINQDTYEISSTGASNTVIKLYDSSFSLIDSSYSTITEALSNNSNYYLSVEFTNSSSSGTISTLIKKYVPHVHSYQYTWNSYTHHLKSCSCGDSSLEVHAVASGSFPPGQQYAPCLICNGMASIGLVGPDSINQYPSTVNGSYILPNGVVVLVAADINDYLNGTLIFNYPNVNSINNNPPYLKKEEDFLTR